MTNTIRLLSNLIQKRPMVTTSRLNFKFKLTDELIEKFKEQQAKKPKKEPPTPAESTLESSLLMGRVSHDRVENVVKVGVPKHRLNDFHLLFVREQDNVYACDEEGKYKPGDWVLIRQHRDQFNEKVTHKIVKLVHEYGNYIDPLTGRRTFGIRFDDDMQRLEKIKIEL